MKKKILMINTYSWGSTGRIMQGIGHMASECGYDVQMFASTNVQPLYPDSSILNISSQKSYEASVFLSKLTGLEGCFAVRDTRKLIRKIEEYAPDIIHLHNLHHGYINLPILFRYLKKKQTRVVWTLHDCWSFTGHCPHFIYDKCDKWKTGCYACTRYPYYPKSVYDNSSFLWKWKKKWFVGLENMTIVTPSNWLGDLVKESFLKDYPVKVIHNGIDLSVFAPAEHKEKNRKYTVLGVASDWGDRKGLDVFIELAKRLPKEYQIILVGTNEIVDQMLPANIVSIHRTHNQQELAEIYTQSSVFVNPTREDTYPTVNLEAIACGTPVVTFRTGGSPEPIIEGVNGFVVDCDDIDAMENAIIQVCTADLSLESGCMATANQFDMHDRFAEYIQLYESFMESTE